MERKLNVVLGSLIEKRRSQAGISQDRLASESQISRTYLSDVERGLRNISVVTLHKIAQALGTKASALFREAEAELGISEGGSDSSINPAPLLSEEPR